MARRLQVLLGSLLVLGAALAAVKFWPAGGRGAPKYPVTGRVTVNGQPGVAMMVRFYTERGELIGQDRQPAAVADADGVFALASYGSSDGAAEGEYAVCFFWPTNLMTMDRDRLKGRFQDPKTTPFRVKIPPRATELPPFEITVPPGAVLPPDYNVEEMRSKLKAAQAP